MNMPVLVGARLETTKTITNRSMHVLIYEGGVFATCKAWIDALEVPAHLHAKFEAMIEAKALELSHTGILIKGQYDGYVVYRWHAADDALETWYHAWLVSAANPSARNNYEKPLEAALAKRYQVLRQWGRNLIEKYLATAITGRAAPTSPEYSQGIDQAIQKLTQVLCDRTLPLVADHDRRIGVIEATVLREPMEFITVVEGIAELGLDRSTIVRGRENYEEAVGKDLKRSDAQCGEKKLLRLSGNSLMTPVNTWRRRDIYSAIGALNGKSYQHLLRKTQ